MYIHVPYVCTKRATIENSHIQQISTQRLDEVWASYLTVCTFFDQRNWTPSVCKCQLRWTKVSLRKNKRLDLLSWPGRWGSQTQAAQVCRCMYMYKQSWHIHLEHPQMNRVKGTLPSAYLPLVKAHRAKDQRRCHNNSRGVKKTRGTHNP